MLFTNSIFYSTVLVGLASQATAATLPIKRQTPACSQTFTGHLSLVPVDAPGPGPFTYADIVPGVTHTGIDGTDDSLIVTKDNDGNAITPQAWEFAHCTSMDTDTYPPGFVVPNNGPVAISFGILRPLNSTQHCLALESEADSDTGSRNSVVDSYCTQVPEEYRTFMLVNQIYGNSDDGMKLYFQSQNTTVTIGNTAHAEVQFFTDTNKPGQAMQLVLAPLTSST